MSESHNERMANLIESFDPDRDHYNDAAGYFGCCDGLEIAAKIVRKHPAESPWISVGDRLPEKDCYVMISTTSSPRVFLGYSDPPGWTDVCGEKANDVTHWMPLPGAPGDQS